MNAWCMLSCFSCVWLCNPMNYIPPGFSVHGVLQARILEWIAISFSRGSSQPRDWTCVLDGQNNIFPQMWEILGHYFSIFFLIPSFLVFSLCICECSGWGPPQISEAVYFSFFFSSSDWMIYTFLSCLQILSSVDSDLSLGFSFHKGCQSWIFTGGLILKLKLQYTLATWWKELTHLKRSWCWERLKVGGEGDNRGWDGWMASLTQWAWVWANSGSWWWIGRPGMLQSMGVSKSRTQLSNWTELYIFWSGLLSISCPNSIVISGQVLDWLFQIVCNWDHHCFNSTLAQRLKHLPAMRRPGFDPWVRKIPWRRKWQPTPVLLPRKSHGQRSLVGYSLWGRKELDMTERLHSLTSHKNFFALLQIKPVLWSSETAGPHSLTHPGKFLQNEPGVEGASWKELEKPQVKLSQTSTALTQGLVSFF